jgi:hypothetical protein
MKICFYLTFILIYSITKCIGMENNDNVDIFGSLSDIEIDGNSCLKNINKIII